MKYICVWYRCMDGTIILYYPDEPERLGIILPIPAKEIVFNEN